MSGGAEMTHRIYLMKLNHVKVFVLAWHICGRILPRSQLMHVIGTRINMYCSIRLDYSKHYSSTKEEGKAGCASSHANL